MNKTLYYPDTRIYATPQTAQMILEFHTEVIGVQPQQLYLCPSFIVMTSPLFIPSVWLFLCLFFQYLSNWDMPVLSLLLSSLKALPAWFAFYCYFSYGGRVCQVWSHEKPTCNPSLAQDVQSQLTGCWKPAPKSVNSTVISKLAISPRALCPHWLEQI